MRTMIIIIASCSLGIISAQTPQFIMPIWFEDSLGNKDTVWVGGDTAASYSEINTQFGEVEITNPFDSIFEVRAVHTDDSNWRTSKIIIEGTDTPGQCILPSGTRIMFYAKYPPVHISWDTTLLVENYPCNINTILTPDQYVFLLQNWYEARIIHCMMTTDSIEIENLSPIPPPDQLEHPFEVEGLGVKVIPGLWFTGFWDSPHCYTTLPASDIDLEVQISLSPNPVNNHFTLSNYSGLAIRMVRIHNLGGQEVYSTPSFGDSIRIPINSLVSGFYTVQMIFDNGKTVSKKIIIE